MLTTPYVAPTDAQRVGRRQPRETTGRRAGIDVNVSNVTVASHDRRPRSADHPRRAQRSVARQRARRRARARAASPARPRAVASRAESRAVPAVQAPGEARAPVRGRGHARTRRDPEGPRHRARRWPAAAGVSPGPAVADVPPRARGAGRRGRLGGAGAPRRRAADRRRPGARARLRAHRRGRRSDGLGAALGPRARGVLAGHAPHRDRARGHGGRADRAPPGGVVRASTRTTALSQHCLCGARVAKRLGDRVHACAALRAASAIATPSRRCSRRTWCSATGRSRRRRRVDVDASRASARRSAHAPALLAETFRLRYGAARRPVRVNRTSRPRRIAPSRNRGATPDSVVVARRIVGTAPRSTLDEPGVHQTTSDRSRTRTNISHDRDEPSSRLRDISQGRQFGSPALQPGGVFWQFGSPALQPGGVFWQFGSPALHFGGQFGYPALHAGGQYSDRSRCTGSSACCDHMPCRCRCTAAPASPRSRTTGRSGNRGRRCSSRASRSRCCSRCCSGCSARRHRSPRHRPRRRTPQQWANPHDRAPGWFVDHLVARARRIDQQQPLQVAG